MMDELFEWLDELENSYKGEALPADELIPLLREMAERIESQESDGLVPIPIHLFMSMLKILNESEEGRKVHDALMADMKELFPDVEIEIDEDQQ